MNEILGERPFHSVYWIGGVNCYSKVNNKGRDECDSFATLPPRVSTSVVSSFDNQDAS